MVQNILEDELKRLTDRIIELEELNKVYKGLFENSFDVMIVTDGSGKVLFANPAFERLFDDKLEEVIGYPIADMEKQTTATSKVLESGKMETVIYTTYKGKQILSTGVPVYDENGELSRIYINSRDISELNSLREKYQESQVLASKYYVELLELKKQNTKNFISHSKEMNQILETVYQIANVDSTVLLLGESGVGKDRIANIIHEESLRSDKGSFVKINCGAIPPELLESELFGYEKGAFTGANKDGKAGYFEFADKGTIFLDEIGELPKNLQVKLLRVIQDQTVTRVGGLKEKQIDVRIIAATNRDLEMMVKQGDFREDLFYRLNVVPIVIPPLRKRREDIPFLISYYLEQFNSKYSKNINLDTETLEKLYKYNWPGNIRELSNVIERCNRQVVFYTLR
ncbi:sigma-54 interaction domain-containing protein [Ureibacillus endophyticus]|uniref:PAS domain-containing protein n=1 Tax=Ureibacillus endophyticus TaxID=1978490 RepID=A0A494Z0A7_9BACL|nr:sigma 54-interacting transcriptional regulator [Lysinibacillus endophyticus]RKQ15963.1 PAS domain-containing protein [Lysinibacillus endophyticus]